MEAYHQQENLFSLKEGMLLLDMSNEPSRILSIKRNNVKIKSDCPDRFGRPTISTFTLAILAKGIINGHYKIVG